MENKWLELDTNFISKVIPKDVALIRTQLNERFDLDLYQLEGQIKQIEINSYDHPTNIEGKIALLSNLIDYLKGIEDMGINIMNLMLIAYSKLQLAKKCLVASQSKHPRARCLERIMAVQGFSELKIQFTDVG